MYILSVQVPDKDVIDDFDRSMNSSRYSGKLKSARHLSAIVPSKGPRMRFPSKDSAVHPHSWLNRREGFMKHYEI